MTRARVRVPKRRGIPKEHVSRESRHGATPGWVVSRHACERACAYALTRWVSSLVVQSVGRVTLAALNRQRLAYGYVADRAIYYDYIEQVDARRAQFRLGQQPLQACIDLFNVSNTATVLASDDDLDRRFDF
jgi:hypothetical protein